MNSVLRYKNTTDVGYWERYLRRRLVEKEIKLLKQTKCEHNMNIAIKDIHNSAIKENLYIPILTNLDGNCMFECLYYNKLCNDIDNFRTGIAMIMVLFKDEQFFIPNQELTLNELFSFRNEVEYVYCHKTQKLYKYTYDTMCIDLALNSSWSRYDTQLLLTVISILLNLRFEIYHDNGHKTEIETKLDDQTKTIYLGQIDEVHYIPLDVNENNDNKSCPKYTESFNIFQKWAKWAISQMNNSDDSDGGNDSDDSNNTNNTN